LFLQLILDVLAYITQSALGGLTALEAPGMFLAAVIFPEGGHSDLAIVYIAVALLLNGLIWGFPVFGIWMLVRRHRRGRALL
jgi:hypothetical protein